MTVKHVHLCAQADPRQGQKTLRPGPSEKLWLNFNTCFHINKNWRIFNIIFTILTNVLPFQVLYKFMFSCEIYSEN